MPARVCPRCQRSNPEGAAFCYFDGALLQGGGNGTMPNAQLAREFVFPSGRRCRNFDEFALGCQEEWVAARDLLKQGAFQQFFGSMGRADLVRAAQNAMSQADGDIALNSFLGVLPVSQTFQPRLDVNPRRIAVGTMLVGDARRVQLTIANQGQGQLQGTLKVTEGADWLSFSGQATSCAISTAKEQKILLEINAAKLVALQPFGGKLTAVTNGGVVEIPVRVDVVSKPFGKPPFSDAKTPREMAERMRKQPKAAGPLLESGEVLRWFSSNNWNYPVQGQLTKGIASVQQFFEAMGLSKPPALQVSQTEVRFRCQGPDPVRFQVLLSTPSRKWVYAWVTSDQPWLKVLTPHVNGPQKATISFEVDGRALPREQQVQTTLNVVANAGQKLPIRVIVENAQAEREKGRRGEGEKSRTGELSPISPSPALPFSPSLPRPSLFGGVAAMAVVFLLVRLGMVPLVDFWLTGADVRAAAAKLNVPVSPNSPVAKTGGWLQLPWKRVLSGNGTLPTKLFGERELPDEPRMEEFLYYFTKYFTRDLVFWLWWLGPVLAVIRVWRRGGHLVDYPFAILAGGAAGVIISATLACVFLMLEYVPHVLGDLLFAGKGDLILLAAWSVLALVIWTGMGAALGLVCGLDRRLRQTVVAPAQNLLARVLRTLGMSSLALRVVG